jgi:quinol monooxygenase YgiN
MTDRKHMRLEYRLKDSVDIETYIPLVSAFVANLRKDDASTDYTCYRDLKDPRHFVHVGHFDDAVSTKFQTQAWFQEFTTKLRELTVHPPDVVMLSQVAPA